MSHKHKIVCITPVRNEGHNIERFLACTSLWADTVILADQNSTDDTVSIAQQYPNVVIVKNESDYNEFERTKLLLQEARKISGSKIIMALDADEIFSGNILSSPEWETLTKSKTGTVFLFDRVNLTPEFDSHFSTVKMAFGFVDDGASLIENTAQQIIHNIRIPWPDNAQTIYFKDIKVLHLSHIDIRNTINALQWYQCFEKVKFNKSDRHLREKYYIELNHNKFFMSRKPQPVKKEWLDGYKDRKIDITSIKAVVDWRTHDMLCMFQKYGMDKFKGLDIHSLDWVSLAKSRGFSNPEKFELTRSFLEKIKFRVATYLLSRRKSA